MIDAHEYLVRIFINEFYHRRAADGTTPLMAACFHGHLQIIHLLLDLNCDVIGKDDNGLTAEDHAIRAGHIQVSSNE